MEEEEEHSDGIMRRRNPRCISLAHVGEGGGWETIHNNHWQSKTNGSNRRRRRTRMTNHMIW